MVWDLIGLRVKSIYMSTTDNYSETNWWKTSAIISIIIGAVILLIFLIRLSFGNFSAICSGSIAMDTTGQVGDFIGGVVGAFWTLASTLFFYNALQLQRKELQENRKEFAISRISSIVFRQFELFESKLNVLKFKDATGHDAIGMYAIIKWYVTVQEKYPPEYDFQNLKSFELKSINLHFDFLKSTDYLETLYSLLKSLDILVQLMKPFSENILNKPEVHEIQLIIRHNFSLRFFKDFAESGIYFLEKVIGSIKSSTHPNDIKAIEYSNERIDECRKLLELINKLDYKL